MKKRTSLKFWLAGLCLLAIDSSLAEPGPAPQAAATPSWRIAYSFEQLGRSADSLLLGIRNSDQLEFRLRRDRLVTEATLQLDYTSSPALLPNLSHLRVYLNDELMGVLPATGSQPGQRVSQQLRLEPRLLGDFNRLRLELVGHYTDVCEDPANSALWLSLGRQSRISLVEQPLILNNDLAHFPAPFFDERDMRKLVLPVLFAGSPTLGEQQAAAILASYFGSLAGWRRASFPVLFEQLPEAAHQPGQPALVFATNARPPAFMADLERFPPVEGPVVQMIDHPQDPYAKLLLVRGRDEQDLVRAVTALAVGRDLLRGQRVAFDRLPALPARRPYDAPNWATTERPVRFAELLGYPQQLQVSGLQPPPIGLELNLPPDLFVWRNQGIPLSTRYRYSTPTQADDSRLSVSFNGQFISSVPLVGREPGRVLAGLVGGDGAQNEKLLLPALKIGERNSLRFDFNFASQLGSSQRERCQTILPVNVQAVIDEDSTIDLSGLHHYMALPDLRAFARSGFPFSRMADLSETLVLVPAQPSALQVGTLLDTLAGIAAHVGYPALGVRLSDDWAQASGLDADLLLFGPRPAALHDSPDLGALFDQTRGWLQQTSTRPTAAPEAGAQAPLAAIVGMQSPFHPQRSLVALLASTTDEHALLRDTLGDVGKLDAVAGSLALIRGSGVSSQFVGERYYVGQLPWWLLLWYHLAERPLLLAVLAALGIVLLACLLWAALGLRARRRLGEG
ncbi:cellulose biosynthesis cyclic di-GMP-binding regulatory protein BcsB [Azotobacter salinestris]|uniref:cellulose biosynthesis cyclic di-GMP-binding regulatory protein BcsB n=1 Tax=Azotobacter salinestris TaxID=69964 RepID=UPI0032DF79EB